MERAQQQVLGWGRRRSEGRGALVALWVVVVGCAVWAAVEVSAGHSSMSHRPRVARQAAAVESGTRHGLDVLPAGLRGVASSTLGADNSRFRVGRDSAGALVASGGGVSASFGRLGPTVRAGGAALRLRVDGVGRGASLGRLDAAVPVARANRVVYGRGMVREWYRNGPLGIEQGFTLSRRPVAGGGWLTVSERVSGGLIALRSGSEIVFSRAGGGPVVLRYGALSATDASGRSLPARLRLVGSSLLLQVRDAGARYPLTIDPLIQQGPKLTASDETGNGEFGYSVALSGDGSTALIGGPGDGSNGAAWVFTRSGQTWTQDGDKLEAGDPDGAPSEFGFSVALSYDGSEALIGAPENDASDGSYFGAAWIFFRTSDGWSSSSEIQPADNIGPSQFGSSVALSSNGTTALIGGKTDNCPCGPGARNVEYGVGAAWVFTVTGPTSWTQQAKLTASDEVGDGAFGYSVALSSDGDTALIGGPNDQQQPAGCGVGVHPLGLDVDSTRRKDPRHPGRPEVLR